MKYFYNTNFGTFSILPDINNGVALWIEPLDNEDEIKLGWYESASMAADDVYLCSTGFDDWDDQMNVEHPTDLSEWTKAEK